MRTCTLAAVVLAAAMVIPVRAAAEEPTLLRVFLTDGTSLVSYGEPARVNERVVFLMPTTTAPNPPLHLVNLPLPPASFSPPPGPGGGGGGGGAAMPLPPAPRTTSRRKPRATTPRCLPT